MSDTVSAPTPAKVPGVLSRVLSAVFGIVKTAVMTVFSFISPVSWAKSLVSGLLAIVKAPFAPIITSVMLVARNPSLLVVLVPVLLASYVGGHVIGVDRMQAVVTAARADAKVDADNAARTLASTVNALASANARVKALEDELTAMQQAVAKVKSDAAKAHKKAAAKAVL